MNERNSNNFDFLRVLAATLICFGHSFALPGKLSQTPVIRIGEFVISPLSAALSIFFAISGFLIARSAVNSSSVINYLWKRFLRIQPLLVVFCVAAVFILCLYSNLPASAYFRDPKTWSFFRNIIPVFGFQANLPGVFYQCPDVPAINGGLWSLVLEERMYLLVIPLVLLAKLKKTRWFLIIPLSLAAIVFVFEKILHTPLPIHDASYYYGFTFLVGSSLYVLNFTGKLPILILSLTIGILGIWLSGEFASFLTILLFPIIIISFALLKTPLSGLAKYGDFTYGIYLFSYPVQQMIIAGSREQINPYFLFFISFAISLLLAFISWHFVEKQFLKLKNRVK